MTLKPGLPMHKGLDILYRKAHESPWVSLFWEGLEKRLPAKKFSFLQNFLSLFPTLIRDDITCCFNIFFSLIFCQAEDVTLVVDAGVEIGVILTDDTYLYLGMYDNFGAIHRVYKENMTLDGSVSGLDTAEEHKFLWGMKDLANDYLYFGTGDRDYLLVDVGGVTKINLNTFSKVAFFELFTGAMNEFIPTTMSIDITRQRLVSLLTRDDYLYTTADALDISGATIEPHFFLPCIGGPPYYNWVESIVIGTDRMLVFGHTGAGTATAIMDINLVELDTPGCDLTINGPYAGITDIKHVTTDSLQQYLFITLGTTPGEILRVDPNSFVIFESFTLDLADGVPEFSIVSEDKYLWTSTNANPSELIRLTMDDFTQPEGRTVLTDARFIIDAAYSNDDYPTLYLGSSDGRMTKVFVGVCKPGTRLPLPCIPCPAGTYSELEGVSDCTACGKGYFSEIIGANTSSVCTICPPGTVSDFEVSASSGNCTICGPGTYANFTSCVECPVGTFHNDSIGYNISSCKPCLAGTYQDSTGSTDCVSCVEGYFSPIIQGTDISVCQPCPNGTYSSTIGAQNNLTCINCPIGYVSPNEAATSISDCSECPVGTFANLTVCRTCNPGTFQNLTGRWTESQCIKCFAGSYQSNPESTDCTYCIPGRYSEIVGADDINVCQDCPAGTFSGTEGAGSLSFCENCPVGTVSTSVGATSDVVCDSCILGQYADVSVCRDCPLGTFGNESFISNVSQCHDCGPGRYSDATGSTICKYCVAGTYSSELTALDSTACVPCGRGYYSEYGQGAPDFSVCLPCPSGTWSNLPEADDINKCTDCPAGSYSTVEGAQDFSTCQNCPAGTYNMISGGNNVTVCLDCIPGFFSSIVGADTNNTCQMCPEGTYSDSSGSISCTDCQSTSYCPPGSSFEMPSTPSKQQSISIYDPNFGELENVEFWYIQLIILFCLSVLLCLFTTICCGLVCCYYKNPIDTCSYFDCFYARLHYHSNKEPITRTQNLFGGACTLLSCYLILFLFVFICSSFFVTSITTEGSYIGSGLENAELVGDPKYTKGRYIIEMLLYGVFTGSSCSPTFTSTGTFSGAAGGVVRSSTQSMVGGTGCFVTYECTNCELTGVKNRITFSFPSGSFATGIEFGSSFPSIYEDDDFSIEGNINADSLHILSGITNPSIIHYVVQKSEYRKKYFYSYITDLFDPYFEQDVEYGLTGAWEDVTIGDQIQSGTGTLISSGLSVAVEFRVAPEKYILEDVYEGGLVLFFVKLAGSIIFVLIILGCCMRCCECVWFKGIVGRKSKYLVLKSGTGQGEGDRGLGMSTHQYDTLLEGPNGMMMRTARDDELGTTPYDDGEADDELVQFGRPPKELVESIIDVDWKEGLHSVELANNDFLDDYGETPGDTPGNMQSMNINGNTMKNHNNESDVIDIGEID